MKLLNKLSILLVIAAFGAQNTLGVFGNWPQDGDALKGPSRRDENNSDDSAQLKKSAWEMAAAGAIFPLNIAVHESGHAIAAMLMGVPVNHIELGRKDLCKWPIEMKRLKLYPGSMSIAGVTAITLNPLLERLGRGTLTEFGFKGRLTTIYASGPLMGLAFNYQVLKMANPDEHVLRYLPHAIILIRSQLFRTAPSFVLGAIALKKIDDVLSDKREDGSKVKPSLNGLKKPIISDNNYGLMSIAATCGLLANYDSMSAKIPGNDCGLIMDIIGASKKVVKSVRVVHATVGAIAMGAALFPVKEWNKK